MQVAQGSPNIMVMKINSQLCSTFHSWRTGQHIESCFSTLATLSKISEKSNRFYLRYVEP